ncbi:MAG: type IV secretion system protein [Sphingobacteriia bacterium]|nr:type IV secretion system protein [Sphingobacteriia bacterium]
MTKNRKYKFNILKSILLPTVMLALNACDTVKEHCYSPPTPGITEQQTYFVRSDGILVIERSDPLNECQILSDCSNIPEYFDVITGKPKPEKFQRGKWQPTMDILVSNQSQQGPVYTNPDDNPDPDVDPNAINKIGINVTGEIYLKQIDHYVTVNFDAQKNVSDSNVPLDVKVGDLIVIKRLNNESVKFRSVAGFDDEYYKYVNPEYVNNPPNKETEFDTFKNQILRAPIANPDQAFISAFGYCRNKLPDNPYYQYYKDVYAPLVKSALEANTTPSPPPTMQYLPDNDTYYKNCFHYDGRGLAISVNNQQTIKPAEHPFVSTGAFTNKYFYSKEDDSKILHYFKAPSSGTLNFKLDKSFFKNAKHFVGNYTLKIERHTNLARNGEMMRIVIADAGLNLNNDGFDVEEAKKQDQIIEYEPIIGGNEIVPKKSGTIWFKIVDTDYNDNLDQYTVNISKVRSYTGWTSGYNDFIIPLKRKVYETVRNTYTRTIGDTRFQLIVKAAVTLSLIMYALAYLLGMVKEPLMEFTIKLLKITLIGFLISSSSWEFFHDHMFVIFETGTDTLIRKASMVDEFSTPFSWMDDTFYRFLSPYMGVRIASLLLLGPFGILIIALIGYALYVIIMVMVRIFLIYCIMMVCTAFLISLAPLFFIFLLFKTTESLYTEWWKLTTFMAFQPAILIIGTIVIIYIMLMISTQLFGRDICWKDALEIYLVIFGFIKIKLATLKFYRAEGMDMVAWFIGGPPVNDSAVKEQFLIYYRLFLQAVGFLMIIKVLQQFVGFSESLSRTFFGLHRGGSGANQALETVFGRVKSIAVAIMTGGKAGLKDLVKMADKKGGKKDE